MKRSTALKAVGIYRNVSVVDPQGRQTAAILTSLEHVTGNAIDIFYPYIRDMEGNVIPGDVFANPGELHVFWTSSKN